MTKVTSTHTSALALPGGSVIPAKGSADVDNWEDIKLHGVVSRWVEAGLLSAGKSSKKDEPEVVENVKITEEVAELSQAEVEDALDQLSEDEEKESLIAQLAELGVKADKRSSVEKLQEKLEEALAS